MVYPQLALLKASVQRLDVSIIGDFCLDRYLEIDPALEETSIETGLPVHNIVRVRNQPGAAGTILNNLVSLGVRRIHPVGIIGDDGEGFELLRCLRRMPSVDMAGLITSPERATFTYTKPLVTTPGRAPVELSRLDMKNWTPTSDAISKAVMEAVEAAFHRSDAVVLMDQVDKAGHGTLTQPVLSRLAELVAQYPNKTVIADSRHGFDGYPKLILKMNLAELRKFTGCGGFNGLEDIKRVVAQLALRRAMPVIVTMADRGMMASDSMGNLHFEAALPLRGAIDVVGAGDAVTATLAAVLSAGASLSEALRLASASASIVIHQVGTTGVTSWDALERTMGD